MEEERRSCFSWVDLLLIGLLALLIFSASFFVLYRVQKREQSTVHLQYTVFLSQVDELFLEEWNRVERGTPIKNANGTATLGKVESISVRQSQRPLIQDGIPIMEPIPQRIDLYLLVSTRGEDLSSEELRVNDIRLSAGSYYDFRVGWIMARNARIIEVTVEEEP